MIFPQNIFSAYHNSHFGDSEQIIAVFLILVYSSFMILNCVDG